MQISSILLAALVRTVVTTLIYVVVVEVVSLTDSDDALGAGLLFFLGLVVLALAWSTYDGVRRGFLSAAVVWVLTGAATGVTVTIAFVIRDGSDRFVDELASGWLFFALLIAVPALVGSGAGGLAGRGRRERVSRVGA